MKRPNPVMGEVGFEALGRAWVFKLTFLAAVELEAEDPTMMEVGLNTKSKRILLAAFTRGLQDHHPGTARETAAAIIDEIGEQMAIIIIAVSVDALHGKPLPGRSGAANPRKAAGTGKTG